MGNIKKRLMWVELKEFVTSTSGFENYAEEILSKEELKRFKKIKKNASTNSSKKI